MPVQPGGQHSLDVGGGVGGALLPQGVHAHDLGELIVVNEDFRLPEEGHTSGVVGVEVGHDQVLHVLRPEAQLGQPLSHGAVLVGLKGGDLLGPFGPVLRQDVYKRQRRNRSGWGSPR